jgi:hypothetical protein
MRFKTFRTFLLIIFGLASTSDVVVATTYYVSNKGTDTNNGRSPQTAWATLARVNQGPLQPGDRVLFQRNDVWRGQLVPYSGAETGCITYGAYGDGQKPLFLGSISKSNSNNWTTEGNGIWTAGGLPIDVGNIIFGDESACGVKVWRETDLKRDGDYWYDETKHQVKLRLAENPAKHYSRVECAMDRHVIDETERSHVVYENLMLKYGAAHGIGGGNTHHITVRSCDISFIGGGVLKGEGDGRVRYGNGVEFWAAAHDNLVEGCRLWEIYDTALTNQSHGPRTPQFNILYRNNVIWNCEYSFEYWNHPKISETHDVYFINNTCVNAGYGWGHAQRPDPSGRHLCFYISSARAKRIVVRNNIFDGAKGPALYAPDWSKAQIDALEIDYNCWRQPEGIMIQLKGAAYTMADFAKYQSTWSKEPHSFCAAAGFLDGEHRNFQLAPNSPCIQRGNKEGIERPQDFNGMPIPQEKSPDIGVYELLRKQ